ncbi:MAG: hypothetical protein ABSG41_03410 [Bryobacteraceae bacterium]|jgi:hypothetical protein
MADSRIARIGYLFVLCASVSAFAQTAPSHSVAETPTPGESSQRAQQFLDGRLVVWQPRLKLEGWRISVVMTRQSDLPPKTMGGIRWDKSKKSAVIWVLDPSDYRLPFREMLDDMELTVVHELVHLDLAALPHGQASRSSEEQAVNGIAQAMLGLDRKKD